MSLHRHRIIFIHNEHDAKSRNLLAEYEEAINVGIPEGDGYRQLDLSDVEFHVINVQDIRDPFPVRTAPSVMVMAEANLGIEEILNKLRELGG